MGWMTDRLIRGVTRRVSMPLNEVLIGASGILELADDMIAAHLVPKMISVREEFFVTSVDYPLTSMVANGAQAMDIPYRAAGNSLRDLKLRITATSLPSRLTMIDLEEEQNYRVAGRTNAFFFKGDQVVLVPPPSDGSWVVEIWHELRPSKLTTIVGAVDGASGANIDLAAQISGIATDALTMAKVPTGLGTGTLVDVVKGQAGNRCRAIDLAVGSVVGSTVVNMTTGTTPKDAVAGDFLAVAGYSPVIQLPDECCVFLETLVAKRCMSALGDFDARTALTDDEARELADMLQLLSPRIRGEAAKTVNRHGLLRGRRSFIRRGYYG